MPPAKRSGAVPTLKSKRARRVEGAAGPIRHVARVFEAYKVAPSGRVAFWRAVVAKDARVLTTWGLVDGKVQENNVRFAEGKVKRSALEQALMETETKWRRKIDGNGYSEGAPPKEGSAAEAVPERAGVLSPMLLHQMEKYSKRLEKWAGLFMQPKLDGVRAPAHVASGTIMSRMGKPFGNPLTHIISAFPKVLERLRPLVPDPDSIFLDGELFAPPPANFHHISGAVRRATNDAKAGALSAADVDYYVYDLFDRSRPHLTFEERTAILRKAVLSARGGQRFRCIVFVPTERGTPEPAALKRFHDASVKDGFEGAVYRDPAGVYKVGGRSAQVLKHKAFFQEEFRVAGVVPKQGKPDRAGAVELVDDKGARFRAGLAMTDAQRVNLMACAATVVGELGTVTFFERTPDGIPRFPILRGFRNDVALGK